jgi:hypothetical protein
MWFLSFSPLFKPRVVNMIMNGIKTETIGIMIARGSNTDLKESNNVKLNI